MNGYAAEKSRSNVQNVHFFILFLNEWTSKCGIFTPHWSLEKPPEFERVWGGLCTTTFADGDKTLLALIKDTQKTSRGIVGPIRRRTDRVLAGYTDTWTFTFRGGEYAYVIVSGDGDTDLDLYIYDENGNLIDSDTDDTDDCVCSFTPRWTGKFYIKIKNRGRVYNDYVLVTSE